MLTTTKVLKLLGYCMVYLCTSVFANTASAAKKDSLVSVLASTANDSLRIVLLKQIVSEVQHKAPQDAWPYIEVGIKTCEAGRSLFFIESKMELLKVAGIVTQKSSDYPKALSYYMQVLKLAEQINRKNTVIYTSVLNCIGTCYITLRQPERGKNYINEAIEVALKSGLEKDAASYYNNLGLIAKNEGHWQQAIEYYRKAIRYGKENAPPHANLGIALSHLKRYDEAEFHLKKALSLSQGNAYNVVSDYIDLGSLYTEKGQFNDALDAFNKAGEMINRSGIQTAYEALYRSMIIMYEKQKDYKNAGSYLKRLMNLKDSLYKETNTWQINELQAKYELDKKSGEIRLLSRDKEIAEARIEKEMLVRNFMLAAALFIILTGIFVSRNMYLKQKVKNKILSEKKTLIENDNLKLLHENASARYEVLKSKTNPHFLFNSLYTLTAIVLRDQKAAVVYIERFSELYRMILTTNSQNTITLADELKLVQHYLYLQKMRFGEKLVVEITLPEEKDRYIIPPFAIQIAAENAIKHNIITRLHKLHLKIYVDNGFIYIVNNLQKMQSYSESTHTGQKSIAGRFELLTDVKPAFNETGTEYIVKLPLVEGFSIETANS